MAPAVEATPTSVPPAPGRKRPSVSLLPAFEPFSSSPALPRPLKRNHDALADDTKYPTPVPTSSTAFVSSPPPRTTTLARPPLERPSSVVSERAPLSDITTIQLNADGRPVRLGRSSASCHYQLSGNRTISRVHVEVLYKAAPSNRECDRVEVQCIGHNNIKVHCLGKAYDLSKGDKFFSDVRGSELLLDVQSARVSIQWPAKPLLGPMSSDDEGSPTKRSRRNGRLSTPPSPSPMPGRRRLISPVSPSPAVRAAGRPSPPSRHLPLSPAADPVVVYEDSPSPEPEPVRDLNAVSQSTQAVPQSDRAEPVSQDSVPISVPEFSDDNDEENDPIVHSFGPFGANLLPRMASFTTGNSPRPAVPSKTSSRSSHTEPLQTTLSPSQPLTAVADFSVKTHVINQLAYSRLSSTPLSTILRHLPEEAGAISEKGLKDIILDAGCIGEVSREGKDAAGKPLESEYYYIPDQDDDEKRRETVVNDLRKPSLRACRKQHKVCAAVFGIWISLHTNAAISNTTGSSPKRHDQPPSRSKWPTWRGRGLRGPSQFGIILLRLQRFHSLGAGPSGLLI